MDAATPADELRQLVLFLATNLVDAPDTVEVTAEQRGSAVHLNLRVPEGGGEAKRGAFFASVVLR